MARSIFGTFTATASICVAAAVTLSATAVEAAPRGRTECWRGGCETSYPNGNSVITHNGGQSQATFHRRGGRTKSWTPTGFVQDQVQGSARRIKEKISNPNGYRAAFPEDSRATVSGCSPIYYRNGRLVQHCY